jgi:hypothetical protein
MCVDFDEKSDREEKELAEFERKLRNAMQHRPAPLGLKQRVLARARERRQAQHGRLWMLQRVGVSIVLAAVFASVAVYRETQERKKGEEAREQVLTALRITNKTLNRVSERLAENSK